jgi:hypothetical protein
MAFQSAANSNRSQNKDMLKKQQNLTYRLVPFGPVVSEEKIKI